MDRLERRTRMLSSRGTLPTWQVARPGAASVPRLSWPGRAPTLPQDNHRHSLQAAVFASGQEFLLGLLTRGRDKKQPDQDSDDDEETQQQRARARSRSRSRSRSPSPVLEATNSTTEQALGSLTLTLDPYEGAGDSPEARDQREAGRSRSRSRSAERLGTQLEAAVEVLQGESLSSGNGNGNGGRVELAVTVDLGKIQPAPVSPRKGTPAAGRAPSPMASRRSPEVRRTASPTASRHRLPSPSPRIGRSPSPGITARARSPMAARGSPAGSITSAASRHPAETTAPQAVRASSEGLTSLEDALGDSPTPRRPSAAARRMPSPAPEAPRAPPGDGVGARMSGHVSKLVQEVEALRRSASPAARRLESVEEVAPVKRLSSVEEVAPVRRLESVEDVAPVKRLPSVEEVAPVNAAYRRAPVPTRQRVVDDDGLDIPGWVRRPRRDSRDSSGSPSQQSPAAPEAPPPAPVRARTPMAAAAAAASAAAASMVGAVAAAAQAAKTAISGAPEVKTKTPTAQPTTSTSTPSISRRSQSPVPGLQRRRLYTADQLIPGEDHTKYDFPDGPRWSLLQSRPLAGGTLDIIRWAGRRMLRVWLPPGYDRASAQLQGGLPCVFMHDGQNLFDGKLSASGTSWAAAETAAELIATAQLPPFVIVGVDHPGLARPFEYTPYKPGTGPGGFREDAKTWPGGGVWGYLDKLAKEVLPWVTQRYALSERPQDRAMAGSSFGGIATLCAAMRYSDVWGVSLVESPSLWLAEEKLLEDIEEHSGALTSRMFIGMGGKEFSGVRAKEAAVKYPEADKTVEGYAQRLATIMQAKGLELGKSLLVAVDPKSTHNEAAWAERLPKALGFLGSQWWSGYLKNKQNHLYLTVPNRLRPNCPGALLVNRHRSEVLKSCLSLRLHYGYNIGWEISQPSQDLKLVPWKQADLEGEWWYAQLEVPEDAYEMHFALSGTFDAEGLGERQWDNNNGVNYYLRLGSKQPTPNFSAVEVVEGESKEPESAPKTEVQLKAEKAMSENPQPVAHKNAAKTFFTVPDTLYAGAPAMVYFNRKRSQEFANNPNCKLHYGWNGWSDKLLPEGCTRTDFKPTQLFRDEWTDWWAAQIDVPEEALELNFAFTDGVDKWDANGGFNYSAPVMRVAATARPRSVAETQSLPHGAGTMHIVELRKRDKSDPGWTKQGRWTDEKIIRVWTPPGYDKDKPPPGGWPVLYLSDGQNKFEDHLAHQGVAWKVGYQSSDLISRGELPPFLVVGIDSAGPMRSLNYLPYAPGSGVGGFRGDAARWPGGGVASYMKRVTEEIMPLVQQQFNTATDPELVSFGGGSFGGVCALYAAMHYPHVFGNVLAESPSLWIAEGRFLQDMAAHRGALPQRIFLGCGTREYSATRDHERQDVDALLLNYCREAARTLEDKGCKVNQGRLMFQVEEGAGHHEGAWAWRFTGAVKFLLWHLWEHTTLQKKQN